MRWALGLTFLQVNTTAVLRGAALPGPGAGGAADADRSCLLNRCSASLIYAGAKYIGIA